MSKREVGRPNVDEGGSVPGTFPQGAAVEDSHRIFSTEQWTQLQSFKGTFQEVVQHVYEKIGVERSEILTRAFNDLPQDAQSRLEGKIFVINRTAPLFRSTLGQNGEVEISWNLFDERDPQSIFLGLRHVVLPHRADRLMFDFGEFHKGSRYKEEVSPASARAVDEATALLRTGMRVFALAKSEGAATVEKLISYVERHDLSASYNRTIADFLRTHVDKPPDFVERTREVSRMVTDSNLYPGTDAVPDQIQVCISYFAPLVEERVGGLLSFQTEETDVTQAFLDKLQEGTTNAAVKALVIQAIGLAEEGIESRAPKLPPGNAVEWLARVNKQDGYKRFMPLDPGVFVELVREMDLVLPIANEFLAGKYWESLIGFPFSGEITEILFAVPQIDASLNVVQVRSVRALLSVGLEFCKGLQGREPQSAELQKFEKDAKDAIEEILKSGSEAPKLRYQSLEHALTDLAQRQSWSREELRGAMADMTRLSANDDRGDMGVGDLVMEEQAPITLKDWVSHIVQKGHIRRFTGLGELGVDKIFDLQEPLLPLSALAKHFMQCWDHYLMCTYMEESDRHYAEPENVSKPDPLTALQMSTFLYSPDQVQDVLEWVLRFVADNTDGRRGREFASAELREGILYLEEKGEMVM